MRRSVSVEFVLYLAIAGLAAWIRLADLGQTPLDDFEASAALAAVEPASSGRLSSPSTATDASVGSPPDAATSAAYQVLSAPVFAVSGATEASARLAPALAGLLLVFMPLLLRERIGRGPAMLAAALLAVSPTLWTASRTAGGVTIGALGVAVAACLLLRALDQPDPNLELAAVALGLALAAGASGLGGALTLGVGSLLYVLLERRGESSNSGWLSFPSSWPPQFGLRLLAVAGVVALAIGSGLGFFPGSLKAVFDGIGAWATGWVQSRGLAVGTVFLQLPAYEPLVLAFGGLAAVTGLRARGSLDRWLACWAVAGLAFLLGYRGRQAYDVLWVVIPLTLLAATRLAAVMESAVRARPVWVMLGAGSGCLALLGFSYLQLRGYVAGPNAAQLLLGIPALLALAWMGIVLAIIALSLVATGWSVELAERVGGATAAVALLALSLSAGARLNGNPPPDPELWRSQVGAPGLFELRGSLTALSQAERGGAQALPIAIQDPPPPSLSWIVRDYPRYDPAADPASQAPLILAREGAELPGGYLGQSVSIGEVRVWPGAYPPRMLDWWLTGSAPAGQLRWVLLVRQDVAGVDQLEQ